MLPYCTNSDQKCTDGTLHNLYSVQYSVCPTGCTYSKPHNTDGTPHTCYGEEHLVCITCCTVALTVSPKIQTAHSTIAIVTKNKSALPVAGCTGSKIHSSDGTPHNYYSDHQYLWATFCTVALTINRTLQTVHHTIATVTKNQSALNVAL